VRQVAEEEVAAALARVYARDEFAERTLPSLLQWALNTWNGIRSWIRAQLASLVRLEDAAPVLFWVIIAVLGVTLLLALGHIFFALIQAARGRERPAGAADGLVASGLEANDPADWERRARAAAAAGRFREAALALYQGVVLRLDQQGVVRFRPGKTAGEYRREAHGTAALAAPFDRFLRKFHPVAFGPRGPDLTSWESLRSSAAELGSHA
jgi:Domain of unknown function (DUF4129)